MAGVIIDQGDTVIVTSHGGNVDPVANANTLVGITADEPLEVDPIAAGIQNVKLPGLTVFGGAGESIRMNGSATGWEYFTPGGGGSYTDEEAQDAVGAMVDASLVYVDATPLLTRAALTGDVTAAQGSNATTVANDAVTNAKLANMATATLKGRNTAGTGDPEDLSIATAKSMLSTGFQMGGVVGTTIAAGVTTYTSPNGGAYNATETTRRIYFGIATTLRNLYVVTNTAQPASGTLVVTVMINGAASGIVITIAAGAAAGTFSDLSNTAAVAAGDSVSIRAVNNSGVAASAAIHTFSLAGQ